MTGSRVLTWATLALWVASPLAAAEHTLLRTDRSAVVEMRIAALIMSGQQGGALPIAVAVVPRLDDPEAFTAMVEIDGAALLDAATLPAPLIVDIFAYVLGDDLDVVDQRSLSLEIDPADHRALLTGTGLKAFVPLRAPAGDHLLRILARAGEVFGLRGSTLQATPAEGVAVRVLPPIFHELDEPWLIATPADDDAALPPPFGLAAGLPLPTTRPVVAAGGNIAAEVFIAGGLDPDWTVTARLRRPGGETVNAPLAAAEQRPQAPTGFAAYTVSFDSTGFEHGPYELAVALTEATAAAPDSVTPESATSESTPPESTPSESAFVPLFIEAAPRVANAMAMIEALDKRVEPAPRRPLLSEAQRELRRQIEIAYRRALGQLAEGRSQIATETLRELEIRAVELLDADALAVLAAGETQIFASLGERDWACLLPVILLHLDLSRFYGENRRFILSRHATRMTVELASTYAKILATPEAAAEAAQAISSLAGYFQHRGALSRADQLFTQALTLADESSAHLGLATVREKRGFPDLALQALEDLVALLPEHAEGRLRLAINRSRTGDMTGAKRLLKRLAEQQDPEWIALLAHQELARVEVDQDRLPPAIAVLRRGLTRWQNHPTLTLQLASVLDAQGQIHASRELIETLDSSATAHAAGERSRYNRWPDDLLIASRRALADKAESRLPDLARWLEGENAVEPP